MENCSCEQRYFVIKSYHKKKDFLVVAPLQFWIKFNIASHHVRMS